MCGIAGFVSVMGRPLSAAHEALVAMGERIAHRGPDGSGEWTVEGRVGLAHRRLAIIDLSPGAAQPMHGQGGLTLAFNGEVYNYREVREALKDQYPFRTASDTECVLAAYARDGDEGVHRLRGMFAFALWDDQRQRLFCARDRFGIKPFYYAVVDGVLFFASEIKALLPFLPTLETDPAALAEYVALQYAVTDRTLFKGVKSLPPGHALVVENGRVTITKYWDVAYDYDRSHDAAWHQQQVREAIEESVGLHLRADVEIGSYLSGGVDSSLVAILAAGRNPANNKAFHGKFLEYPGYDESGFARDAADRGGLELFQSEIRAADFPDLMRRVIFHLDHPVAGPGSIPQYVVSGHASEHVKVVLGGQGGDEIFGGYARYLVGYMDQLIAASIDGVADPERFPISMAELGPMLASLREYKPLISSFWAGGLFQPLPARYWRLCDRSVDMRDEVDWSVLDMSHVRRSFDAVFDGDGALPPGQVLDAMSRFDLKCLLPALLQVEDRMSMAHGIESRVPLVDHVVMERAAAVPPEIKYGGGQLKRLLRDGFAAELPETISQRRDKMGFPVPLKEWFANELRDYVQDVFRSRAARERGFIRSDRVLEQLDAGGTFSRKIWGLLSLEIWHQTFLDDAKALKKVA